MRKSLIKLIEDNIESLNKRDISEYYKIAYGRKSTEIKKTIDSINKTLKDNETNKRVNEARQNYINNIEPTIKKQLEEIEKLPKELPIKKAAPSEKK